MGPEYQNQIIHHLQSGRASADAWAEVAQHLAAESECEPLLLDVEMGLATVCPCGDRVWLFDHGGQCDCGRVHKREDVA